MRNFIFWLWICANAFAQTENIIPLPMPEPMETKPAIVIAGKTILESPKSNQIFDQNEVEIFIRTEGGNTDPAQNRFHIFLDRGGPMLHEDERRPLILKNLSDGGHIVRVVAIQANGQAYPLPDSYAAARFFIKKKDLKNFEDLRKPYITVNLPSNDIAAPDEQGRICMDFLVHNAKLSEDGYQLRYRLDQFEAILNNDQPVYWNDVSTGRHTLTVELLEPSGNPALGLLSKVQRKFEVAPILQPLPQFQPLNSEDPPPED